MYYRALQDYEFLHSWKHKSTLNTTNNLGCLYVKQGRLLEAERMFTTAL